MTVVIRKMTCKTTFRDFVVGGRGVHALLTLSGKDYRQYFLARGQVLVDQLDGGGACISGAHQPLGGYRRRSLAVPLKLVQRGSAWFRAPSLPRPRDALKIRVPLQDVICHEIGIWASSLSRLEEQARRCHKNLWTDSFEWSVLRVLMRRA